MCALKNHQNHCKAKPKSEATPKSEVAKDFQTNKGSILQDFVYKYALLIYQNKNGNNLFQNTCFFPLRINNN